MAVKFQLRRDTAADWTANNPILSEGEPGVETDTLKFKLGDGTTAWTSLDYAGGESDFNELINKPTTLSGYGITDAASSAQGSLADTAVQPGDLAAIATSGSYNDLSDTPTTLAGYGITDAATSAQGSLADTAVQPGDLATVATSGSYNDLDSLPTLFDGAYSSLSGAPTNVSAFTNDSAYLTSSVFGSAISITDSTASTSTTTGALKVTGGVGVGGNLYAAKLGVGTSGTIEVESSTFTIKSSSQIYIKPNSTSNASYQLSDTRFVSPVIAAAGYADRISAGVSNAGSGIWTFACAFGLVFRVAGDSIAENWTTNFTGIENILTDNNDITAITIIINQGTTPYMTTNFQIGGVSQTVQWLGGFAPSGTSNATDVLTLLVSATSSSAPILASLATYG